MMMQMTPRRSFGYNRSMITRLRVQGFKNMADLTVRFGPFTCIAGLNAAGKSNLFDAIRFLHLLTQKPIMEAVGALRDLKGRAPAPGELFTRFGEFVAPEMRFEVDLVVDPNVEDEFGVKATAAISTLRYEVAFRMSRRESGILELAHEELRPVALGQAIAHLGFSTSHEFRTSVATGRRTTSLISTAESDELSGELSPVITVHQEGHGGRKLPAPKSTRTVAGGLASSDFPTILAVNREMSNWKSMLLEPTAMRSPSLYHDPSDLDARGANLPNTIYRLEKPAASENAERRAGRVGAELANRLSRLVEDVVDVRVREDEKFETRTLQVQGRDGVFRPAHALSDGTLRFLVLSVLEADPHAKGVICIEEPENGIHPSRIPAIVELLRDIAVDPDLPVDADNPLRQVIINTHSPSVVGQIPTDDLVYIEREQRQFDTSVGNAAVAFVVPGSWRSWADKEAPRLVPGQVLESLGEGRPRDGQSVFSWATSHVVES